MGFEVRVERTLLRTQLDDDEDKRSHGLRVGWSTPDTSLLLGEDRAIIWTCVLSHPVYILAFLLWVFICLIPGEDELSFAYEGRGVKVSGGTEEKFGEPFGVGDIIGCYAVCNTLNPFCCHNRT